MKERRVKCKECGERFSYIQLGGGRPPLYCPTCAEERTRELTKVRVQKLRDYRHIVG